MIGGGPVEHRHLRQRCCSPTNTVSACTASIAERPGARSPSSTWPGSSACVERAAHAPRRAGAATSSMASRTQVAAAAGQLSFRPYITIPAARVTNCGQKLHPGGDRRNSGATEHFSRYVARPGKPRAAATWPTRGARGATGRSLPQSVRAFTENQSAAAGSGWTTTACTSILRDSSSGVDRPAPQPRLPSMHAPMSEDPHAGPQRHAEGPLRARWDLRSLSSDCCHPGSVPRHARDGLARPA